MRNIETLQLKSEYQNHPRRVRKALVNACGYDVEHYKKYWLKEHFNRIYNEHDATGLCLKECSQEELDEIALKDKVELVEKTISEYFNLVSHIAQFADFEEDKYNYYSVISETKRTIGWCTIRVLKY